MPLFPAGKAGLEQEIGELVEQGLQIHGVSQLWIELGVRVEPHRPLSELGKSLHFLYE